MTDTPGISWFDAYGDIMSDGFVPTGGARVVMGMAQEGHTQVAYSFDNLSDTDGWALVGIIEGLKSDLIAHLNNTVRRE